MADEVPAKKPEPKKDEKPPMRPVPEGPAGDQTPAPGAAKPMTPPEQARTTPAATADAPGASGGAQPAMKPPAPTETPTPAKPAPAAGVTPAAPAAPAAAAPVKAPPPPRPKTVTPEIQSLLNTLGAKAQHLEDTDPNIPTILIEKDTLLTVMSRLKNEFRFEHLACITAVDVKEQFELIYNLWSYSRNQPFEVKVRVPRADPVVPSLCSLWIGANWLE